MSLNLLNLSILLPLLKKNFPRISVSALTPPTIWRRQLKYNGFGVDDDVDSFLYVTEMIT